MSSPALMHAFVGRGLGASELVCQSREADLFLPCMSATEEEKKKARRAILILYTCMILGIGLPIILYFALR